jgi:Omp85 superfamily domain
VALFASVNVTDWLSAGSSATASARLGTDQQFDVRDLLGAGPNAHFTQTYRATLTRTSLPQFRSLASNDMPTFDVKEVAADFERRLSNLASIGVGLAHQWSNDGAVDAGSDWSRRWQSFSTLSATLRIDTYDRGFAPTQGYAVLVRSELAAGDRAGNATFSRHLLDAQGAFPMHSGLSVLGGLQLGYAAGANLPEHDRFFLGGSVPSPVWPTQFIPFLGLAPQSRVGASTQVVGGGVQALLPGDIIATVRGNVGNVFDSWPPGVHRNDFIGGAGITIATMLPPGPLSLTVASRGLHIAPITEITFGSVF